MTGRLIALILILFSWNAQAKLDLESTEPMQFPVFEGVPKAKSHGIETLLPSDIQATDSMNKVASRIADRSLQNWFGSTAVQTSSLGQTASTVQQRMSTNFTLKPRQPQGVEHNFSMQFLAFQAMAKLQYSGWLKAVFNYDASASESVVEVSDKIYNKNLFVNHTTRPTESTSSVGIKWGW